MFSKLIFNLPFYDSCLRTQARTKYFSKNSDNSFIPASIFSLCLQTNPRLKV